MVKGQGKEQDAEQLPQKFRGKNALLSLGSPMSALAVPLPAVSSHNTVAANVVSPRANIPKSEQELEKRFDARFHTLYSRPSAR
jgi:hypothetical protein